MKSVIIIAIVFVLLIPSTAFAQEYMLFFQIDKEVYYEGESVVVSGNVRSISGDIEEPVTIKILYDSSFYKIITEEQVAVAQDGSFTKTFESIMDDKSWKEGEYGLVVSIGEYVKGEQFRYFITDNLENGCPEYFPDLDSDGLCYNFPEPKPLENGCSVDYPYLWKDGMCYTTMERVYKEAEMGFYSNERYEFSFEAPMNWSYQEGYSLDNGSTFEVLQYPTEFSLENAGDDTNMMDVQMSLSGATFQFESPLIYVDFENLPTSKVSILSEKNLKEYALDKIMINQPNARITDSSTKSNSWGWEVYATYNFDLDIGVGTGIPYVEEEYTYFFKDRESYTVGYGAPAVYFEEYKPVFDHVLDTLIIKSVAVPEFGSIAMLVLVTSIIVVLISVRRFQIVK